LDEIAPPPTFRVLLDADDIRKLKGGRDVQETQFLCEFTIKLLLFLAKARKIFDFLLKHRDLNAIGSRRDCQSGQSPF
jgi:hypothetical protein